MIEEDTAVRHKIVSDKDKTGGKRETLGEVKAGKKSGLKGGGNFWLSFSTLYCFPHSESHALLRLLR